MLLLEDPWADETGDGLAAQAFRVPEGRLSSRGTGPPRGLHTYGVVYAKSDDFERLRLNLELRRAAVQRGRRRVHTYGLFRCTLPRAG